MNVHSSPFKESLCASSVTSVISEGASTMSDTVGSIGMTGWSKSGNIGHPLPPIESLRFIDLRNGWRRSLAADGLKQQSSLCEL